MGISSWFWEAMWFHLARMNNNVSAALDSLEGLSVGDAIGEALSYNNFRARERADFSAFRPGTVRYTDDTEMASGILEVLSRDDDICESTLAALFSMRYLNDPHRGYFHGFAVDTHA